MKKLGFLTLALSFISLCMGPINIFTAKIDSQTLMTILWELRLPRTLMAILTGYILGLSGAVLQGFLRNPLADASLMGIGSGAAFGAVAFLSTGFMGTIFLLPLSAMVGAIVGILILIILMKNTYSSTKLILAGIALNSLFGSFTSLILNMSADPYGIMQMLFWLFGSYGQTELQEVGFALPFMILGIYFLWKTKPFLNVLSFGEDIAKAMGYPLQRGFRYLVFGVGLSVGSSVALCGIVGFIGLVVPHIVRPFYGEKPGDILLPSALCGTILSLFADTLVRILPCALELKVGVITALIGAPFFMYILYKEKDADL